MTNKENKDAKPVDKKTDNGFTDTAKMDVNAYIVIKDKDTGKVLVNKRG